MDNSLKTCQERVSVVSKLMIARECTKQNIMNKKHKRWKYNPNQQIFNSLDINKVLYE